ncbi:MAG TPA: hypothetical protein VLG48_06845, partial [Candidatus Methylomirabilis sp.]|nr:hypothetical protein [Candidatus Methylomirabilis sp.]
RGAGRPAASAPSTASVPSPEMDEELSVSPSIEVPVTQGEEQPAAAPPPEKRLTPISMRAVGIDARGLHLQDREGKTNHLVWQHVKGISVATIGGSPAPGEAPNHLILDLLMASKTPPMDGVVRCIRLSIQDLAIPQLQNEPTPLRGFQRFVATILKTTGGCALPSRESCLGVPGFPAFPSLAAYEADLLTHLQSTS